MRLGIDLGGTKIEIIALGEDGRALLRKRVPTPAGDYTATILTVAKLISDAEAQLGVKGASVGIGLPGAVSGASGLLKNSNSTCLNGRPILRDLESMLDRPVSISNDANCFALSEATDGAAAGAGVVFGAILGTGTGAGIVVGGRILAGKNGIAGEWGHNPLPWPQDSELPGLPCYCGKSGCIETFLSGPGLQNWHFRDSGVSLPPEEIVLGAQRGERACEESLRKYENRLARSLSHVINILDPDVIVLGGGLSNIERLYDNVPRLWGNWVFSDRVDTRLVKHRHGDSSGVRGAARL